MEPLFALLALVQIAFFGFLIWAILAVVRALRSQDESLQQIADLLRERKGRD